MKYKFEDIIFNITEKKKPVEEDKYNYIGLEHLESGNLFISKWGSDTAPEGEKIVMKKGDVLFGKRRAYQKKVAISPIDGIFSAHGMVLRPKEDVICKEFLPFFISSETFLNEAIRISVGGLSPTVNWKDIRELEFDLPSLAEQKVLAEKLWAAYEVKQSYLKMIAATEEMVKAQFVEMFYVSKFPVRKLKEHIEVLRGVSYKPTDVRDTISSTTSVILRSNNIDNGRINYDDLVYVNSERVSDNQLVSAGDIVMCGSNGSKKLVGKAALVNSNPEHRTSFGAFCLGIRCKSSILPKYLSTYFQTSIYREVIEFLGSGSNILNIKPDHINNLEIPIPDIESQLLFVNIVDQADKSISELRRSVDAIDKVIKSLINENL